MRREVFQYRENVNNFLKVGSTTKLQAFHTFTYCTAAASGGSSDQLPMADAGGFTDGDTIYVGANASVTISSGATGVSGAATVTMSSALSFSNNDTIAKNSTASLYDDPDLATSISQAVTLDTNNETPFFAQAGPHAVRISSGADATLRLSHNQTFRELDWATVLQGHASPTAGILEAVRSLSTAGGTVYIPAGTFSITAAVLVATSNIRIIGAGKGKTIIKQAASQDLAGGLVTLASAVTGFEMANLTIDGNSDNNTGSTANGILLNNNTDVDIHNITIQNVRSLGIANASSANPLTRCHIRDCYLTNIGNEGIELFYAVGCQIVGNNIYRTNSHGISLEAGTSQDTDYSRRCLVEGNIVDRSAAASTSEAAFSGSLLHVGGGTESCAFTGNVLHDNSTQSAAASGISWGHSAGGRAWGNNTFDGNVVALADTIGIEVMTGSSFTNNMVYLAGTHGMRFVPGGAPTTFSKTVISGNQIIDANDDNVTATNVHGISLKVDADTLTISNVLITNNLVADTRVTKRLLYALGIVKAAAVTGESVTKVVVTGNDFSGVDTASVDWAGDTTTDVALADLALTSFYWRDNLTVDAYRGEETLVAGVSGTQAQNTNWPAFTNLVFNISRTNDGGGTAVGTLSGEYNGSDTLTITSYSRGSLQTFDPSVGASRAESGPIADDGLMNVMSTISTISVHSVAQQEAPGAYTVDRMIFRTGTLTGATSIAVHLEDSEGTPNVLTAAQTLTTAGGDDTWYEVAGSGTAAVAGSLLHLRGSGEVGDVTLCEIDEIIIVWDGAIAVASGDISKVFWEFLGTAD